MHGQDLDHIVVEIRRWQMTPPIVGGIFCKVHVHCYAKAGNEACSVVCNSEGFRTIPWDHGPVETRTRSPSGVTLSHEYLHPNPEAISRPPGEGPQGKWSRRAPLQETYRRIRHLSHTILAVSLAMGDASNKASTARKYSTGPLVLTCNCTC